jgi:hypothetical protein
MKMFEQMNYFLNKIKDIIKKFFIKPIILSIKIVIFSIISLFLIWIGFFIILIKIIVKYCQKLGIYKHIIKYWFELKKIIISYFFIKIKINLKYFLIRIW